ncbi:MAG: lipoyl synthase [Candidatus Competibacteraceae bacterium]|nr:lipoyl synthase [Candidatus Competibacteraceae bacterium]
MPELIPSPDSPVAVDRNSAAKPVFQPGEKLRGAEKVARIPIKIAPSDPKQRLRKPPWIRAQFPGTPEVMRLKQILRDNKLHTVCEEASCPNLGECFGHGTATFMIMGDICTRRCPFCDVGHGRPKPLDPAEPANLAATVAAMGLKYVVITSVDRDDLRDGGAAHFAACIRAVRAQCPGITIETLTPDFRGRMVVALEILEREPPDVFNHNLETIPRLYRQVRPGADYEYSLDLLKEFRSRQPRIPSKSGLMLGLGETLAEIEDVMRELRAHDVQMLTLGQYLQPSMHHLPVSRYVSPEEFEHLRVFGETLGFTHVASAPMVRSSYHADAQAKGAGIE